MAFVIFEIPGVERAVSSEEALRLANALYDRVRDEKSMAAYHLALRIDAHLRGGKYGNLVLSPSERAELLTAMEAAELGREERTRLQMLRDALTTAALSDLEAAEERSPDIVPKSRKTN